MRPDGVALPPVLPLAPNTCDESMSRHQRTRFSAEISSPRPLARPAKLRAAATLLIAASLFHVAINPAPAQEVAPRMRPGASIPLPPQRPADLGGAPAAAPVPSPPPGPQVESPAAKSADSPFGFRPLPPAPRERMHACGLEWRKMKMEGAARDKIWRDFAEECLRQ
ncbi:hypothetical protein CR492_14625 [Methylocella silvestris]|uniref:Uncharacterized protein n=1 Tax=Methylocella silvestris TaxID=199596 RepID=A0A2J7TEK8_METSI|nr:hypothetical protein CR492_14625 [Methylocella silvestris]